MNILHVSCSPRGQLAESFKLSQKIISYLLANDPAATVVNRVIGGGALSHVDATDAVAQHWAAAEISQEGSIATSDALIQELERADVVVIGTPMHNLSIPSSLKAWIDHV